MGWDNIITIIILYIWDRLGVCPKCYPFIGPPTIHPIHRIDQLHATRVGSLCIKNFGSDELLNLSLFWLDVIHQAAEDAVPKQWHKVVQQIPPSR